MKYVYILGRAVELLTEKGGHQHKYNWKESDRFIVACDDSGRKIYILKKPSSRAKNLTEYFAEYEFNLEDIFRGRVPKWCYPGRIGEAKRNEGTVLHVVYNTWPYSRKHKNFIHVFSSRPTVKMDRPNKPKLIIISGEKVKISHRGILG